MQTRLLKQTLAALAIAATLFGSTANAGPEANQTVYAEPEQGQKAVFGLPFATPPGPSTWLMGQSYGNTVGAYYRRVDWYGAGQGIHFGIDLSAKCGTPVVAIGDGTVALVDALYHGSLPHNLSILHPNGYISFYGHLLETPNLRPGQPIRKGDVIAKTGDPDLTCTSRPHLHLEIRDRSHARAYNPIVLIDTDWDALSLTGAFGRGFQRDLDNPRKWQTPYDQPEIQFGGPLINEFTHTYPQDWR